MYIGAVISMAGLVYIFSSASSFLFFVFVIIWVLLLSVPFYSRILSAI